MKIANIIIDSSIKVNHKINVVSDYSDRIVGLPTLIVGMDKAKSVEPNIDFIDRRIDETTFWTFTKKERRGLFEEDLYYFNTFIYDRIRKQCEYIFIDLILMDIEDIKKYINNIEIGASKIVMYYNDMVYVNIGLTTYGIDLRQVKYLGKDIEKLNNIIIENSIKVINNDKSLIKYNSDLEMFSYEIKYIPIIYRLNNYLKYDFY